MNTTDIKIWADWLEEQGCDTQFLRCLLNHILITKTIGLKSLSISEYHVVHDIDGDDVGYGCGDNVIHSMTNDGFADRLGFGDGLFAGDGFGCGDIWYDLAEIGDGDGTGDGFDSD